MAGPGTLVYSPAGVGAFEGWLAEGLNVRKTGSGEWLLSGHQDGAASLSVEEGRALLGAGLFTGAFEIVSAEPFVVSGTTFGEGASLALHDGATLQVEGATDLRGLTLHVAEPLDHLAKGGLPFLVCRTADMKGMPAVIFGVKGYKVEVDESDPEVRAFYADFVGATTVYLR